MTEAGFGPALNNPYFLMVLIFSIHDVGAFRMPYVAEVPA